VITHPRPALQVAMALVSFCLVSSGTYYLNDLLDAPADRRHPTKRERPIASGLVPSALAVIMTVTLMAGGLVLGLITSWRYAVVLGIYVVLQFAYSFWLKHQPVLDICTVAAGFVLRGIGGAVAVPVSVSEWFLIVTTFGSLLMVTGKRLAELIELGDNGTDHRVTLGSYSASFLRTVLGISAAGAIVGYCLWAFDLQTALVHRGDPIWYQLSIVPMVVALLRFTYLVEAGHGAKPEELVFSDRVLQASGVAWAALFALGVYVH